MTYAQLDHIADAVIPLLIIGVVAGALWLQRTAAWRFLLRAVVATVLVQQSAKAIQHLSQHLSWLGPRFPSTHFAVALCLATFLALLHRKLIPLAAFIVVTYGALMLWQGYHTPLEMAGALPAVPIALAFGLVGRARNRAGRRAKTLSN